MSRPRHLLRFIVIASCVASAAYAAEQAGQPMDKAEADGVIYDRQQIMQDLEKQSDKLGKIFSGDLPADQLAATTRAIAKDAADSVQAFKAKVPGGRAKPEVWANYADFSRRMDAFAEKSDAMAKLAEGGGSVAAVTSVAADALPCKDCHELYRAPKTPTP